MASVEAQRVSGIFIATQLSDVTSPEAIVSDPLRLTAWNIDGVAPACSVSPGSAAEVADVLKLCAANNWTVVPAGGFSMQSAGRQFMGCDVLLRTDRLNRTVFYDPGDLTIGLEAGVTVAQQRLLLGKHKQWLPLPRRSANNSTMGGVAATAISGPAAAAFGGVREFCIGVQFVTGDGKIARGGGRVVKNVAGYDLMKLMIGSYGTLGVITELNFKVFPAPIQTRTYVIQRQTPVEIVAERDRLMSTRLSPLCFEVISPRADFVLGNAGAESGPWRLALRGSGTDAVLARYKADLGSDATELTGEADDEFWRKIEDFPDFLASNPNAVLLQVACVSHQFEAVLKSIEAIETEYSVAPALVGRAALGSFLVGLASDMPATQLAKAVTGLRTIVPPGVMVNALAMPPEAKAVCDPWDVRGAEIALMSEVKKALDPAGILNRGRYVV